MRRASPTRRCNCWRFEPILASVRSPIRVVVACLALVALGVAVACGAEDKVAPRPEQAEAQLASCQSFEELMPRFNHVMSSGVLSGLRDVMTSSLLTVEGRPGEPPPVNDLLRAAVRIMNTWAKLPPEPGAASGAPCAVEPPDLTGATPLCEARRAMETMVHQGHGKSAAKMLDPMIAGLLDYLVGRPPSSSSPHYEVAAVLAGMCQQNRACQLTDTLDLLIGLTAFLETADGRAAMDRTTALIFSPELAPYFSSDGKQFGDEAGIVALVRSLLTILQGMENPSELDSLDLSILPDDIEPKLREGMADLKLLLDPNRVPNVLGPLKKVVSCYTTQDPNSEVIRMVYRLGFEADHPAFGIYALVETIDGVRKEDARGSLLFVVRELLQELKKDELAVDAAAQVCATLLSTETSQGGQSNAEQVLPGLADAFDAQVLPELLCAVDTLVFGCAGGEQPACE